MAAGGEYRDKHSFDQLITSTITTTTELLKLYVRFGEFILMEKLLADIVPLMDQLIEASSDETKLNSQLSTMSRFRIKLHAYVALSRAGLRDFRFARLSIRKCLSWIETELMSDVKDDAAKWKTATFLKVECLRVASECYAQIFRTYSELSSDFQNDNDEIATIKKDYDQSVAYAREAFLLSRAFIDPKLRAQTAFTLGNYV